MKAEHFEELLREAGGYGRYQVFVAFMLALGTITTAFHNMGMVFLAARPSHHCQVNASQYVGGLNTTIPWENKAKLTRSKCLMYNVSQTIPSVHGGEEFDVDSMVHYHVDTNVTVPCKSWQYDDSIFTSTVVSEWNLVCSREWLIALGQSIYMFGFFTGCVVFGDLSDRFGRKHVFILCAAIQCAFGIAASFSPVFPVFVFLRYVVGAATGGMRNSAVTLAQEFTIPEWRSCTGCIVEQFWGVGYVILGGIAYFIRDWRNLQLALSIPSVFFLLYIWLIPNSPRWLLAKGRVKEAEAVLKKTARLNGMKLPEDFYISSEHIITDKEEQSSRLVDLVKTPNMRKTSFIVWLNWFVVSFCFFGLTFNVGNLGGNIYLDHTIYGLIEIVVIGVMPLVFKCGRRLPFCVTGSVGGLLCLLVAAVPPDNNIAMTIVTSIGKSGSTACFLVAYVYTSEVYPTVIRNSGLGVGSMWARVGAIVAPFVILLPGFYPYIAFGVAAGVAGFFALMLPETYGRPLCDTVESAEKVNGLQTCRGMFSCKMRAPAIDEDEKSEEVKLKAMENGHAQEE